MFFYRFLVCKDLIVVFFSSVQDVPALYPDRIVSIRGDLEAMSAAERQISFILRECHERESSQPMVRSNLAFMNETFSIGVDWFLWFQLVPAWVVSASFSHYKRQTDSRNLELYSGSCPDMANRNAAYGDLLVIVYL